MRRHFTSPYTSKCTNNWIVSNAQFEEENTLCKKLHTISSAFAAISKCYHNQPLPLFVFSIDDPKQNAVSLLTPVSSIVLDALSHSTLRFAFHGSFNNHSFQRI